MINNRIWIKRITSIAIITVLVGSGLLLQVKPVQAVVFTLTVDTVVDDPTKTACISVLANDCSLRGAITHINADPTFPAPEYHIVLGTNTYTLTHHGINENVNATGDLDITYPGAISIDGAGALTVISGDLADRVIELHSGTVSLSMLSVKNGMIIGVPERGGGIYAGPGTTLNLSGVEVASNSSNSKGGGIGANHSTVFLFLCDINNNQAPDGGGMLVQDSNLTAIGVTFSGNTATSDSGGGLEVINGSAMIYLSIFFDNSANRGGGIFSSSTMSVFDSAILGNHATTEGGGILAYQTFNLERAYVSGNDAFHGAGLSFNSSTFNLIDVTIANNTSVGTSAVEAFESTTALIGTFDHVTITGNTSSNVGSPLGPVALFVYSGSVRLMNSIINATDGNAACELGTSNAFLTSFDYNIASDGSCNLILTHDHPNTDPQIKPPEYYGGLTLIAPPIAGSIAIDNANPSFSPTDIDQRGAKRADGDFNGSVIPDIGASEFLPIQSFIPMIRKP